MSLRFGTSVVPTRRRRFCFFAFLSLKLGAGCGPSPMGVDAGLDAGPVEVLEVGTTGAQGEFVALQGDAVAIPGSQGGYHVNVMYRLPKGGSGKMSFDHRVVRVSDNKLVSLGTRSFDLGGSAGPGWTNMNPVTVFMCPTPVGVDIIGQELLFTARAKNAEGNVVAEGMARAVFRCGPNGGAFCEMICKG